MHAYVNIDGTSAEIYVRRSILFSRFEAKVLPGAERLPCHIWRFPHVHIKAGAYSGLHRYLRKVQSGQQSQPRNGRYRQLADIGELALLKRDIMYNHLDQMLLLKLLDMQDHTFGLPVLGSGGISGAA